MDGIMYYHVKADNFTITVSLDPAPPGPYLRIVPDTYADLQSDVVPPVIYPHQALAIRAIRRGLQDIIDAHKAQEV